MKKSFIQILALAGAVIMGLIIQPASASHLLGSEITYTCIAPNTFVVDLKLYRDCTGMSASNSANLILRSTGCNNGRTQAMTKVLTSQYGVIYCAQLGNQCSSTSRPNYEVTTFTTTVTFSAAETGCPDWTLGWTECCRPSSANILNAQSFNLYAQAYVRLTSPNSSAGISNNSPKFQSEVVPLVLWGQTTSLSLNAEDIDGDSLVYSLQPALHDAVSPVTYSSLIAPGGNLEKPHDPGQVAAIPVNPQPYSPQFPLPSYQIDWSQPAPRSATPFFELNPQNGSLRFNPAQFVSGATSVSGQNKYVVVVQVDEYRKINGVAVKIGHVRRDMLFIVDDPGPNVSPVITAQVANGQAITPGAIMDLRPGTPLTFTFATADANFFDSLHLESDVETMLPGAVFTQTAGAQPTGTITWTPTSSHVQSQVYYFRLLVKDDACPVNAHNSEVYGVRVSNTGGVTGIAKSLNAQPAFIAYPNPFASAVTFKVKQTQPQQEILIYNVLGQQVDQLQLKGQLNTEQEVRWINAAKFPAGQYLVRFSGSAGQSLKINKLQ